jgi:hypothetical protein
MSVVSWIADGLLRDEADPKSLINKWPAVMLAVSRTASVIGRIRFLRLSIRTKNGIRAAGVLIGTRWQAILLKVKNQPAIWIPSQNGIDRNKVITKCLVEVNTYGRRPPKFIVAMNKNRLLNIIKIPEFILIEKMVLISFTRTEFTKFRVFCIWLGEIQNFDKTRRGKITLSQFIANIVFEEESNDRNKFCIRLN